MRDEFYGDRKDLWKWTVVLNEAGEHRQVLYVAMYRPDGKMKRTPGVRVDVSEFFQDEREAIFAERKCSRIGDLSSRIIPFLEVYDPEQGETYFASAKRTLESRSRKSNYVVFLDPDTGIREHRGPEHVAREQLTSVWKSMIPGDTLLIYQHYARKKIGPWLTEKTDLIAKATQSELSAVTCKRHSGVCFFSLGKNHPRN